MKRTNNYMCRETPKPWTYGVALEEWGVRYCLMCQYLDEIDAGDLTHLEHLRALAEIETTWCSFDNRLVDIIILGQKFYSDSEGGMYEIAADVENKVKRFKEWLQLKTQKGDEHK